MSPCELHHLLIAAVPRSMRSTCLHTLLASHAHFSFVSLFFLQPPKRTTTARMKPLILHFAGLSALLAVIEANELPPQSIPVQCATICGPIVELTALCSKKRSVPLNKPRLKRHMEQPRALEPLPYLQRDTYKHKRVFVTLVPPPPAVSVPQSQQPTPQPASHPPPVSQSPKQPPPPPASPPPPSPPVSQTTQQKPPPPPPQPAPPEPPAQTSQASKPKEKGPVEQSTSSARASRSGGTETAAMSPVPSMKGGTSMSGMVEGSGGSSPEMDSSKGPESNEEICVCENRSFDVATLTGLCASCVASKSKLHDAASECFSLMSMLL